MRGGASVVTREAAVDCRARRARGARAPRAEERAEMSSQCRQRSPLRTCHAMCTVSPAGPRSENPSFRSKHSSFTRLFRSQP